jgi:hypothetical protein
MVEARGTSKSRNSLCPCGHWSHGTLGVSGLKCPEQSSGSSGSALRYGLSLGFGAFPATPPPQTVVLTAHRDRYAGLALRLSQGCPSSRPLVVHAFRWALGPSQLPRRRKGLYFPFTPTGSPSWPYGFPRAAHSGSSDESFELLGTERNLNGNPRVVNSKRSYFFAS